MVFATARHHFAGLRRLHSFHPVRQRPRGDGVRRPPAPFAAQRFRSWRANERPVRRSQPCWSGGQAALKPPAGGDPGLVAGRVLGRFAGTAPPHPGLKWPSGHRLRPREAVRLPNFAETCRSGWPPESPLGSGLGWAGRCVPGPCESVRRRVAGRRCVRPPDGRAPGSIKLY